jgi:DNA-directed RNA polymerase beta subunit
MATAGPPSTADAYRLMHSFLREGFARDQVLSFDKFIDEVIPEIIAEQPVVSYTHDDGISHRLELLRIYAEPPTVRESSGTRRKVTPAECVLRGKLTYALRLKVHAKYTATNADGTVAVEKEVVDHDFDYVPCMKFSRHCNARLGDACEAVGDPGGYFVIEGQEKVVTAQEQAVHNTPIVTVTDDGKATMEVRSQGARKRSTSTLYVHFKPAYATAPGAERQSVTGKVTVQVPYVNEKLSLPVLLRILGVATLPAMVDLIADPRRDPPWFVRRVRDVLTADAADTFLVPVAEWTAKIAKDRMQRQRKPRRAAAAADDDAERYQRVVAALLSSDLLPQQGYDEEDLPAKTVLLGVCIRAMLRSVYGLREPDDRDSYVNRRAVLSAPLLTLIFRHHYSEWKGKTTGAFKRAKYKPVTLEDHLTGRIGVPLTKACSSGNFSVQRTAASTAYGYESAGQPLTRIEPTSVVSSINKLNNPVSGKAIAPRLQATDAMGCVDPSETPDSRDCGLIRTKAAISGVRHGYSTEFLCDAVRAAAGGRLDPTPTPVAKLPPLPATTVYVNGRILGVVDDGVWLHDALRALREHRDLPWDVSLYIDDEGSVQINGSEGSLWWPLLRADRLDVLAEILERCPGIDGLWARVVNTGCVEAINKDEERFMVRAALSRREFLKHPAGTFRNLVIHPSQGMSATSARQPFPECNQSPRNVYSTTMFKQTIGLPLTSSRMRFDTTMYSLRRIERPIVSTFMDQVLGGPSVQMAVVLIMCERGYNIEDSFVFNRATCERGFGIGDVEHSYKTSVRMGDAECDKMMKPPVGCTGRLDSDFASIDPATGVALPGTKINTGSAVLAKVAVVSSRGAAPAPGESDTGAKMTIRDRSVIYKAREPATVTQAARVKTLNGETTYRVKTRATRTVQVGVKYSCLTRRHAVLCRGGFFPVDEVTTDHEVACLDPVTEQIVYHRPTATHRYNVGVPTEVVAFGDYCAVTLNHRMCLREAADSPIDITCAETALSSRMAPTLWIATAAKAGYAGVDDLPVLNALRKIDRPLEALVLTLGFMCHEIALKCNMSSRYIPFSHSNAEGIVAAIGADFAAAGCTVHTYGVAVSRALHSIFIEGPMNGVPFPWTTKLSAPLAKAFLRGYTRGTFNAVDEPCSDIRDRLEIVGAHAGMTSFRRWHNEVQFRDDVAVPVQETSTHTTTGGVYCLTVPTGVFAVRSMDNRAALHWTGNSRHGQKGTCGIMLNQEDMPFMSDGTVADIIFNPHGFPSRMTWGQLLEMHSGLGALFGDAEEVDATPFTTYEEVDGEDTSSGALIRRIAAKLEARGLDGLGRQEWYDGRTGKRLSCLAFAGPLAMCKLKHDVMDKMHARTYGPMVVATNQPVEGRAANGASRVGEMEAQNMIDHGAAYTHEDRHHHCSDRKMVWICHDCGFNAVPPKSEAIGAAKAAVHSAFATKSYCHYCQAYDTAHPTAVPGGFHLFQRETEALHIKIKHTFPARRDAEVAQA